MTKPTVSLAQMLENFGDDRELIAQVADVFLDDYAPQLAKLDAALATQDMVQIQAMAHGIKGSVGNFGALEAVDAARAVELACKNQDMAAVRERIPVLNALVEGVARALREQLPHL